LKDKKGKIELTANLDSTYKVIKYIIIVIAKTTTTILR
jgi:hypothetical protein